MSKKNGINFIIFSHVKLFLIFNKKAKTCKLQALAKNRAFILNTLSYSLILNALPIFLDLNVVQLLEIAFHVDGKSL
jgi:hypothetical protein